MILRHAVFLVRLAVYCTSIFVCTSPCTTLADTLILKNGREIKAEQVWEEGGVVKYSLYGSVVGHPKADVLEVKRDAVSENQAGRIDSFFYPWKLGQTINEVVSLCQRYDYPLHRNGLLSVNTHYHPKMCMPYINSHSKFNYKATTYGYPSVVFLEFNPVTKRLGSIETRITKPSSVNADDFVTSIGRKLSRDYGEPDSRSRNWGWISGGSVVSLSNDYSVATVKLAVSPIPKQAVRYPQTNSPQPVDVYSQRIPTPKKNALPSVNPAPRNPIEHSGRFVNQVLKGLAPILISVLVVFAILAYLKVVIQRKILGFLSKGLKSRGIYARFARDFSSGHTGSTNRTYTYEKVSGLFTAAEKVFLSVLAEIIGDGYLIQGKVRLADLISPESTLDSNQTKWAFRKISQKHVDFVICDKADFTILGVVELDDKSHLRPDRIARDKFVDAALSCAGIPIMHYPVNSRYEPADIREKLTLILGLDLDNENDGSRFQDSWRAGGQSAGSKDDLRWAPPGFKS